MPSTLQVTVWFGELAIWDSRQWEQTVCPQEERMRGLRREESKCSLQWQQVGISIY